MKDEYPAIPVEEQIFRPPKTWTAWPLPPDEVPRSGERRGSDVSDEQYTYKRCDINWASRELEDVLMGVALKFARERFEGREEAGENVELYEDKGKKKHNNMKEDEEEAISVDGIEESAEVKAEAPRQVLRMRPVVSADDERSRVLLRPSIRHTLSKLDEVLMALHHARKSCRRYSLSEANTDDEDGSLAGERSSPRKPQGRPRKFLDLPDRSIVSGVEKNPNDASIFRAKKTHRGRPQKAYPRMPGENQQDYVVRIARIQKKPLPSFAPLPPVKVQEELGSSPERKRAPSKRATVEELGMRERRKLRLRDWSEVIGSAALVGFSEDVIERATQRCANLFGEGMMMRTIVEKGFGDEDAIVEKTYRPETIPALGDDTSESLDDEEEGSASEVSDSNADARTRNMRSGAVNKVFCPMPGCPRKREGFRHNMALKRHLQSSHQIPYEQVEEYILPSDDEMDGAVHVDGFLRRVKDFRTTTQRRKAETKEESVSEDDSDGMEEHEARDEEEADDQASEHETGSEITHQGNNSEDSNSSSDS